MGMCQNGSSQPQAGCHQYIRVGMGTRKLNQHLLWVWRENSNIALTYFTESGAAMERHEDQSGVSLVLAQILSSIKFSSYYWALIMCKILWYKMVYSLKAFTMQCGKNDCIKITMEQKCKFIERNMNKKLHWIQRQERGYPLGYTYKSFMEDVNLGIVLRGRCASQVEELA